MNMPQFTAEASVYRNVEMYVLAARRDCEVNQQVIPQDLIPPNWSEFCTGCYQLSWGIGLQTCCRKTPVGWICWQRFCDIPR